MGSLDFKIIIQLVNNMPIGKFGKAGKINKNENNQRKPGLPDMAQIEEPVFADEEEEEEARRQALRCKKMIDKLAIAKPGWRKQLVEAKQIAVQNLAKFPEREDDDEPSPPPPAAIEYRAPSPLPQAVPPKPEPFVMSAPKPKILPDEEKISLKNVGKNFCKNLEEEDSD